MSYSSIMQTESLHLLLQLGVGSDGVAYHLGCSVGLGEDVGEHIVGREVGIILPLLRYNPALNR